jgi:hypothetical protein
MTGRRLDWQQNARHPTTAFGDGRIHRHGGIDPMSIQICVIGHLAAHLGKGRYTNHG